MTSPLVREPVPLSAPAPRMMPRIAASSRSIAAEPAKPALDRAELHASSCPWRCCASCSVSSAPGRHAATAGMSAKTCPHLAGGLTDDEALLEPRPAFARPSSATAAVAAGAALPPRRRKGAKAGSADGGAAVAVASATGARRASAITLRTALTMPTIAGAAAQIARQLHRGCAARRRRAAAARCRARRSACPGVQKPHCSACSRVKASRSSFMIASSSKPSMVRTSLPVAGDRIGDAGARGLAVDQHRAGAAHAVLAAEMRAGEPQLLAQEIGEVRARLDQRLRPCGR